MKWSLPLSQKLCTFLILINISKCFPKTLHSVNTLANESERLFSHISNDILNLK